VKAKTLLLFVPFVFGPAIGAVGQVNCTTSNKLVCELPTTSTTVAAAAIGAAQAQSNPIIVALSASINSSIGTQLTQLPIPSASVGTVSLQQAGNPFGVPFDNLGPVLTDRPDTVGKRRVFVGFNYQRFNFNALNGIDLGKFPIGYVITQANSTNTDTQTLYGSESADINFHLDQYVGILTYGLTRTTDVSVVVPFSNVSLAVTTSNFQTYVYDTNANQYSDESPTGQAAKPITTTGSASGVGDVILTVKQLLLGQEGRPPAIAVGADFRIPSGDALNYLGSGAFGFNLHGLFEYRAKLSPHLKLGYQWNTNSQLVDIYTAPNIVLPGGLQYDAGADYRVVRQLTVAVDVLGSQFVNTNSVSPFTQKLSPTPSAQTGEAPASLPSISVAPNTYTTANVSAGLKWHPMKHWIFYGNVLIPINNVGLRSDPVPLAGISFTK
jgi:hypothetical protein